MSGGERALTHVCGDLRIRLNDPALVPGLLAFLSSGSVGCLTARVGAQEIEASLLGSYNTVAHDRFLELLVDAWAATEPKAVFEFGSTVVHLTSVRSAQR